MTLSLKQRIRPGLSRAALALTLALALCLAGWAHHLSGPGGQGDPAALSFYLATGAAPGDLCGHADGAKSPDRDCPACRMPALPGLPLRLPVRTATVLAADVPAPPAVAPQPVARHPAWQGRAPPVA